MTSEAIYFSQLLKEAVELNASDIHLITGMPPLYRMHGNLIFKQQPIIEKEQMEKLFDMFTTVEQKLKFQQNGDVDFAYSFDGYARCRGNAFLQQSKMSMVLRLIKARIPTLKELGHPPILAELALKPRGLVIVTGPTGTGKTTTIAAMINLINQTYARHIISLEDPIEYVHTNCKSIIHQREVYTDTKSFSLGLKAALREDPDVIVVGEMRDKETIAATINAALSGHLVFTTLHTSDTVQTIERVVNAFEPYQQQEIKVQLSMVLQGIVTQQLVNSNNGTKRVAALEIMIATPAIRNLIREGKTHQILSCIQTGAKFGMQTMNTALKNLANQNLIKNEDVAILGVE